MNLVLIFSMIAVVLAGPAQAQDAADARTDPFWFLRTTPSFDKSVTKLDVNGITYSIPRRYVFSTEKFRDNRIGAISMRTMLPGFTALTQETGDCFLKATSPCAIDVITIGITAGSSATAAQRFIENLKNGGASLNNPSQSSECGFEYYTDSRPIQPSGQGFIYFFRQFPDASEPSFLRCTKRDATMRFCNATENISDGNSIYYVFDRSKLCEWPSIRSGILGLISSFRKGE